MSIKQIEADDAYDLIQDDDSVIYLDVRTEEEFNQGCPEGAILIPLVFNENGNRQENKDFLQQVNEKFDKSSTLIVGCRIGHRSMQACETLAAAGFNNLYNLTGGYEGNNQAQGWKQLGLPSD